MFVKKIKKRLESYKFKLLHMPVRKDYRARYTGKQPTIFACNCIGGIMYSELGLRFTSPTINLYMNCEDFIKFCERIPEYLALELQPYQQNDALAEKNGGTYPLGVLGDLILHFVHYGSFEEAKAKWDERKKRVDLDNVYVIACDRDGFREELLDRFDKLPYAKKCFFSHLPREGHEDVVYLRGYEGESEIPQLMKHTKRGHLLIDQFDWVGWLNRE